MRGPVLWFTMSLETGRRLDRARYAVDFAVHGMHVQILNPEFKEARKTEEWMDVFASFPGLKGETAFLRSVSALRSLLQTEAQSVLDAETEKVRAAYAVANELVKADAQVKAKRKKARV